MNVDQRQERIVHDGLHHQQNEGSLEYHHHEEEEEDQSLFAPSSASSGYFFFDHYWKMIKYNFFQKRTTDNSILLSWQRRILLLVFAMLQNGLAGGIIFGWASIDKTMLIAPVSQGGAGLSMADTTSIFAYASCVAMFSTLVLGILLDIKGPRICSIVCCVITGLGCQLFAIAPMLAGQNFWIFVIGGCFMALGGPVIGASIIHIANLFPNNEFLVMSCLSGSVAFSFSSMAVFDMLWEKYDSITYQDLFNWYAWVVYGLAIGALVLYPDEPYEEYIDEDDLFLSPEDDHQDEVQALVKQETSTQADASPTSTETTELLLDKTNKVWYDQPPPPTSASSLTIPQRDHLRDAVLQHRYERRSAPEFRLIHEHHHQHHIQSVAAVPSLSIEQPLDSYLRNDVVRDGHNHLIRYDRTDSFKAAETALKKGDKDMAYKISLKDQPFFKQLWSATYFRAVLIFFVSCFVTNFYVASLSTELADLNIYTTEIQHQMARDFTIIIAMGIIVSIAVGFLIDSLGIEVCTAMTLASGMIQNLILLTFGSNYNMTLISFVFYTMFRQFLYPVFIASLTSRLGFKYFGILLGIGFAIAGIAQPAFTILSEMLQGDCHAVVTIVQSHSNGADEADCSHGHWMLGHVIQIILLGSLLIVPWFDYQDRIQRETRIKEVLASSSS